MSMTDVADIREGLLATLLADESFHPAEPRSMEETGISAALAESLILKHLSVVGAASGRSIADFVCLPFGILDDLFRDLRTRQFLMHTGSAPLNDYTYALTEQGRDRANAYLERCGYVGPAPVRLMDYVLSVEAQTIRAEAPKRSQLQKAFNDISIDPELFESLGPAINSGAGLFLYGSPGNGKSTIARRITMCFGQQIWMPQTLVEDGHLIKLFDAAYHEVVETKERSIVKGAGHDRRWVKVRRPTVVVGGELTLDGLEIRHDPLSNVCEAPLQLRSNCGCLLIDDFGRQRIEPAELLNRWIVPLEARHDFLTLPSGKKIQVPFEQLIIFSTNLEPKDLVDEAFLRRIPYKIEINDPDETEFLKLFELYCRQFSCDFDPEAVEGLLARHYRGKRPMRRCHPRDLLSQVRNVCAYNSQPMQMLPEHLDKVVKSYFTVVVNK